MMGPRLPFSSVFHQLNTLVTGQLHILECIILIIPDKDEHLRFAPGDADGFCSAAPIIAAALGAPSKNEGSDPSEV